jgi:acetyltransferase-like isoleucine patch superfamily enzyme
LGPGARLGQWNWVSSAAAFWHQDGAGELELDAGAAATSRHYFDCSGGITIEQFATVAGVRSTFITHGIDVVSNEQRCAPIVVGRYSLLGSNAKMVPGASVPDHCLVAMGAVVVAGLDKSYALYAGSPAKYKRDLDRASSYFTRSTARVSVAPRRSS